MLKFRSMVTDAEQLKDELQVFNEMEGPVFKVTNDPRVTRIGRILRRWSIDEWPQMINVLLGQMSLEEKVGQTVYIGLNAKFANQNSDYYKELRRQVVDNHIGPARACIRQHEPGSDRDDAAVAA